MKFSELHDTAKEKVMPESGPIYKYDIFDTVKVIANLVEIWPETLMDGLLGSAGKQEISGDIDLAIDDKLENIVEILKRNRANFKVNKGLNCVHILVEIKGPDRRVMIPNYTGKVQVDLFFGEVEWLKFSHFSAGSKSKYKGAIRTILLSSIISATTDFADFDAHGNLIAKVGPIFNLSEGIKTQYRIAPMKKRGVGYIKKMIEVSPNDEEFIHRYGTIKTEHININNPDGAAQFLFGRNANTRSRIRLSSQDLETFEQVYKLMQEHISLKKQKVIQTIFRNRTGIILPISENANINDLQKQIKKTYPQLSKFGLSVPRDAGYDRQSVNLAMIEIKSEYRNTGIGSLVMKDLISWADQNNMWITLSLAEKHKGGTTSRSRLVKFYKRFGFIENKGRNKDYALSRYAEMYRKPNTKINEAQTTQMPWNNEPMIGWWLDNDTITFYHGTHKDALESILQNGLQVSEEGRTKGITYLALEPFTGRGYGAMSGETKFRAAGGGAKHVMMADRVTIVLQFPKSYVEENMNWNNLRLKDKSLYDKFNGSDHEYYELTEVWQPGNVPVEFIKGYM